MSQSKFWHEGRLLAKLSGPIIVGQLGQNLIILADTIMVGSLGPLALGASAFAGSVFVVFLIFAFGVLAPITALIAKAEGQEDHPRGGVLLHHSVGIALGLSAFLVAVLYILMSQLHLLGQTKDVIDLALPFFEITIWSLLPSLLYQTYKQFTDGIGKTKVGMGVMIFGVVFNIAGNFVLINGYWGFPKLGLNGAAWATLMARTLMALAMIAFVHFHPMFKKYLTERWSHRFDRHLTKSLIRLGLPTGMTYIFEVGAFSAAAVMMGWFGSSPLAAHQITISLASMTFLVTIGVGIAASIRVGYEIGRDDRRQARFAGMTAIKIGATYMAVCGVLFMSLRWHLPKIYVTDPDVIAIAAGLFIIVALFQIFDGIQAVSIGALRGMSDTQIPGIIAFFAYWIIGLPTGYFLAFHAGVGPMGVWIGLLIALIIASSLLTLRFHILSNRYLKP
ncbi:MATE family efflux transporter [Bdellovibrio bacteriovorus]|uniref:MATE family efflux transporter n=1 Tax=Bdellovibrio bacteriovorus TaxID=959 RepID=UPI0009C11990|nr:MATE family efflux transporter [Bdellovibrio bacteriovorus]